MSRTEEATRTVLAGILAGIANSWISGGLWTISMLWDIVFWIAVFAVLPPLWSYLQRRRRAKGA